MCSAIPAEHTLATGEACRCSQRPHSCYSDVMPYSPVHALQVVDDALQDYFTKKKSRLSAALLKALLKEHPSRQAAEALMGYYSSARNAFLKAEAVQLLQTLMHPVKVSTWGPTSRPPLA